MPSRAVHVILNPKSGGGRAGRLQKEIAGELRARDVAFDLYLTEASGHAAAIAKSSALSGAELIVAAGGDGTIHEVANGILASGTSAALGVLPFGTGNDFAKVVPGARNRNTAYDVIANPCIRFYDVGYASWEGGSEYFVNGMGTGIDVEVVRQIQRLPALPGPLKYLVGLLRALAVYEPVALMARAGALAMDSRVMMMAVGNGVCQGGGFYLTPDANPDDGHLDLCVISAIPMWQVPFLLPRVLRGTHAGHAAVTMRTIDSVRFEAAGAASLYFQLDGELREPAGAARIDVEIRSAALAVATQMERNS